MNGPGGAYVDWLDDSGLLDLRSASPGWPESDPLDDETDELEPREVRRGRLLKGGEDDDFPGWLDRDTIERVLEGDSEPGWEPETQRGFDFCAWYSPMHFHRNSWGIRIRNDCLVYLAWGVRSHLDPWTARTPLLAHQLVQGAFMLLFQHEIFHHKVEALAIRLEIVEGRPVYVPYWDQVYVTLWGTDDCLEEGVANAFAYRWMKSSTALKTLGREVRDAGIAFQEARIPHYPPGYRMASHYMTKYDFDLGEAHLGTQVHEATSSPLQAPDDFGLATHLTDPLYNFRSKIWVVVHPSVTPALPTYP